MKALPPPPFYHCYCGRIMHLGRSGGRGEFTNWREKEHKSGEVCENVVRGNFLKCNPCILAVVQPDRKKFFSEYFLALLCAIL